MRIDRFVTGAFYENCYLVADPQTRLAVLIDPGDDAPQLIDAVKDAGVTLTAIWLTHAHLDHLGAVGAVKRAWNVPVLLHPADLPLYRNAAAQAAALGLSIEQPPEPDGELLPATRLALGSLTFAVMHTPGHSPGHVVIHGHTVAFVGDCLFAGSIGRTDLPLGDSAALARSLRSITALPSSTRVLPGHGPGTTVGEELDTNPFLAGFDRAGSR